VKIAGGSELLSGHFHQSPHCALLKYDADVDTLCHLQLVGQFVVAYEGEVQRLAG
jgi:hypothetical protein